MLSQLAPVRWPSRDGGSNRAAASSGLHGGPDQAPPGGEPLCAFEPTAPNGRLGSRGRPNHHAGPAQELDIRVGWQHLIIGPPGQVTTGSQVPPRWGWVITGPRHDSGDGQDADPAFRQGTKESEGQTLLQAARHFTRRRTAGAAACHPRQARNPLVLTSRSGPAALCQSATEVAGPLSAPVGGPCPCQGVANCDGHGPRPPGLACRPISRRACCAGAHPGDQSDGDHVPPSLAQPCTWWRVIRPRSAAGSAEAEPVLRSTWTAMAGVGLTAITVAGGELPVCTWASTPWFNSLRRAAGWTAPGRNGNPSRATAPVAQSPALGADPKAGATHSSRRG